MRPVTRASVLLVAHPVVSRGTGVAVARLPRALSAAVAGPIATSAAGLIAVQFVVLAVWGADTRSGAGPGAALRVGADLWLLAHGSTLRLGGGPVDLVPLGLALIPVLVAASAGYRRAAARTAGMALGRGPRGSRGRPRLRAGLARDRAVPAAATGSVSTPSSGSSPVRATVVADILTVVAAQTVFVCLVAVAVRTSDVRPGVGSALVGSVVLSGLGATIGVLSGYQRMGWAWRRLPGRLRVPLAAGATATVALVATSAAGVAVVLAVAAGRIASASGGLGPGIVGGVGLLAIQAAVLPNLIVWALGYALGPGFAAGPDGWVSPSAVGVVDLPDLPVLRALPTGALPGWAWLILAIFPLVGGSMLVASVRRATPGGTFVGRLGTALAGAAVCGLLVGLLAEFSAGGIGSAGAARLGPAAGWVGLAAGAETGLAAVVVTAAVELVARRESAGFVPVRTASLKRWLQAPSSWLLRAVRRQS